MLFFFIFPFPSGTDEQNILLFLLVSLLSSWVFVYHVFEASNIGLLLLFSSLLWLSLFPGRASLSRSGVRRLLVHHRILIVHQIHNNLFEAGTFEAEK
jgi:hypothetical protein